MKQAHLSEIDPSRPRRFWQLPVERLARRPRVLAAALTFAAVNAGAAITVLMWTVEADQPVLVTHASFARVVPVTLPQRVAVSDVVRYLPRAQTWHPPHMLPSQRVHAVGPDAPRTTPVLRMQPNAGTAPTIDTAPAAQALAAALPRDVSPEAEPEVRLASLMPFADSVTPPAIRPQARPEFPEIADLPDLDLGTLVTVSLRPQARPKDLTVPVDRITPPDIDAPAATTLAALPREIKRPVGGSVCNQRLTKAIPNRKGSAKGGSAVMASLMRAGGTDRDKSVAREIMSGNVPGFLQDLVPVEVSGRAKDGSNTKIVFCVMPDYLAVGSDRDFVRIPMGLPAAMQIASRFDMMLPTRRMVDQIYRASDLRVSPKPMTPGSQMSSTDYLVRHNATVEGQVRGASSRSGKLVSGHKKDLVLSNRLESNRGRVAIYGWHRSNGKAIQPLSTVHGANYADYSHGVRLVSQTAYLNGRPMRLADLFADPTYAGLISDEGPIPAAQLRVASAN